MKQNTCSAIQLQFLLLSILFFAIQIKAACVKVDNEDLIEYSCEGGSVEDLKEIPDNTEKIRISNMPIDRLDASLFSRFGGNLVVLTCSHCQITDIDDNAFRRLQNLQQLSLDNNRLKEVRAAWFQGLSYLTYLDLNYNGIERIEGDVFRHMPELVDLRISGNRLVCLDIESMSRLRDLKRIFLNENPNFGCPNAVKRFLKDRNVDFEVDPHWNSVIEDRVNVNESLSPEEPEEPEEPEILEEPERSTSPPYTRPRWTEPVTTTTTATPPTHQVYVPEMIQPSVPEQDFSYQGPYYAPKVTPQELENYRNNGAQEQVPAVTQDPRSRITDPPEVPTSPRILIAGQQPATTSTECPNAAMGISRGPSLILSFVLITIGFVVIF